MNKKIKIFFFLFLDHELPDPCPRVVKTEEKVKEFTTEERSLLSSAGPDLADQWPANSKPQAKSSQSPVLAKNLFLEHSRSR